MKKYDVLISEEICYRYRVEAKDDKEAQDLAMDIHEAEGGGDVTTVDRCEIIDCREAEE